MAIKFRFTDKITKEEFLVPFSYSEFASSLWKKRKNSIIELPFYTEYEYLIPFMYTFNALDKLTPKSLKKITDYDFGDTLIFEDYVFKYLGIHNEYKDRVVLRFAEKCDILINIDECPLFMKSDLQRLSSIGKFHDAISDFKRKGINRLIQNQHSYPKSCIYFTVKSKVKDIITNLAIDDKSVVDNFLVSEIIKGKSKSIGAKKKTGVPLFILCSDIESLYTYCEENPDTIGSVFIEDEGYKLIYRNLNAFEMLLDNKFPIYIMSDWNTADNDQVIENYRFEKVSLLVSNYVNLSPDNPKAFNLKYDNFYNSQRNVITVSNSYFGEIREQIIQIKKIIDDEVNEVQELFYKIVRFSYRFLDCIVPIGSSFFSSFENDYQDILCSVLSLENYLSPQLKKRMNRLLDLVELIKKYPGETKNTKIMNILNSVKSHTSVAIVYDRKQDVNILMNYFKQYLYKGVVLLSTDEYLLDKRFWDNVIITAYYKNTFQNVIGRWNYKKADILLYKYQEKFYRYSSDKLDKRKKADNTEVTMEKSNDDRNPIFADFEFDINLTDTAIERKYKSFQGTKQNDESSVYIDAIPFTLSGDYVAFFPKSKKLFDATDLIVGRGDNVVTKEALNLRVGDFIAIRESDRDLIRSLVDINLKKNNSYHLRESASAWSIPLFEFAKLYGIDELHSQLRLYGSNVNKITLRNWVYDEDMIGPRNMEDIEIINKFTGGKINVQATYDAISSLRVLHQNQGRILTKQLSGKLKEILSDGIIRTRLDKVSIEDVGEVRILRINSIGSVLQVAYSDLNRLHGGI